MKATNFYKAAANNGVTCQENCTSVSLRRWEYLMEGAVKANGEKIKAIIKKHLPELYEEIGLNFYNPYQHQSQRTKTHLVYVHSAIEYFIKIS